MDPQTSPTLAERAAALAVAAANAPAFGGLRTHLTDAADFAAEVVAELDRAAGTESALVAQVADLTARLEALEAAKG